MLSWRSNSLTEPRDSLCALVSSYNVISYCAEITSIVEAIIIIIIIITTEGTQSSNPRRIAVNPNPNVDLSTQNHVTSRISKGHSLHQV